MPLSNILEKRIKALFISLSLQMLSMMVLLYATTFGSKPVSSIIMSNCRARLFSPNLHRPFPMVP
uniref:Uncharacterized protein n=1 Tax=Rhizophora mucronata TaxID=61149 RepID=A0A2P2QE63_RHIMU